MSDCTEKAKTLIQSITADNMYRMAVSEATGQSCDVLALRANGEWVEFEIKTSKADLRKELRAIEAALVTEDERKADWSAYYKKYLHIANTKIQKHSIYLNHETEHQLGRWKSFTPHKFYFAVPYELEEYAIQKVKAMEIPYGVCSLGGTVVRNAKKLTPYIDYQTMVSIACRAFGEQPFEENPNPNTNK